MSFKSYFIINKYWDKTLTFMVINAHLTPLKLSQSRKTTSIEQRPWVFKKRIFRYSLSMLVPPFQKCDKNVTNIIKILTKMWQNTKMWPKTDKNLTKMYQNPKCIKNVTKIVLKCSKNVSKCKIVFKFWQNGFQKSVKKLTKTSPLTDFCHIFFAKMKHLQETFSYKN